jgi:hypothetical protein
MHHAAHRPTRRQGHIDELRSPPGRPIFHRAAALRVAVRPPDDFVAAAALGWSPRVIRAGTGSSGSGRGSRRVRPASRLLSAGLTELIAQGLDLFGADGPVVGLGGLDDLVEVVAFYLSGYGGGC